MQNSVYDGDKEYELIFTYCIKLVKANKTEAYPSILDVTTSGAKLEAESLDLSQDALGPSWPQYLHSEVGVIVASLSGL